MERNYYDIYRPKDFDENTDDRSILGSEESLENTAGPNFADFARHLTYEKQEDYALYEPGPKEPPKQEAPKNKEITTLFLIDSKNRDKNAFPQPTSFTLKPPRVYKNVVSIQVTQIKLLSSFLYFRTDKGNTVLPLNEIGRIQINSYLGYNLTKAVTIREGTYNINDLLTEIQTQMNQTPVFYDFPESTDADATTNTPFSGFVNNFTTNGDLSVNFNQPGDIFYDRLNSKYIQNPTIASINSYYWASRYAGLLQYSIDQVKVAYYYPVLYEAALDTAEKRITLNLNIPSSLLLGGETAYSHIIFNCSGLNDEAILYLINQNIEVLDRYRLYNTFRYFAVNRYQLAYDTNTLRVNILSLSLNTSLVNLINLISARNLATVLDTLRITAESYATLNTSLNRARVVYTDMYNFLQSQLTKFFAIPYAKYASQYFNLTTNTIYIENGLNATGIRKGYTTEYLTSGEIPISSMVDTYSNSPGYWPNYNPVSTLDGKLGGGFSYSEINLSTSMTPYNVYSKNFQFGTSAIDENTYLIQTNKSTRSVDVVATIKPGKYTIFKFKSSARQTLQVETLPLPYYYRFSDYNAKGLYSGVIDPDKNNVPQKYFDISYSYVYNPLMDNVNYSTIQLEYSFGQGLTDIYNTSPTIPLNSQINYTQLEFTAPYPAGISSGLYTYNTSIAFVSMLTNTVSTLYADKFNVFVYHDRAAFMADVQNIGKENPLHYILSKSVSTTSSDITFNVSTFAGHTYYTIFRSDSTAFSNILMKPVVYYSDTGYTQIQTDYTNFDPTANPYDASNAANYPFVINYNTDFLRLPMRSSLQGIDPDDVSFKKSVAIGGTPIGYDISGVSDDLTDYMGYTTGKPGFIPNSKFRMDPISQYVFQNNTGFDSNVNSYFPSSSRNSILIPITNNPYVFKGTSSVQSKIVHWYDGFTIPRQADDQFTTFQTISTATRSSITQYLPGYPVNSNGDIKFGRGINAIGFTPTDGLYDVSSFTFKSSIYPISSLTATEEDPNLQIQYIGVFSGLYLAGNIINFSDALTVLTLSKVVPYGPKNLSNTTGFGYDLGTWYEYAYNPSFVAASNVSISGYTPADMELLSYNSMYYMVPFNSDRSNVTFTNLVGSLLPYPLYQTVSTGTTFFNKVTTPIIGVEKQPVYITPSTIGNANSEYGPAQGLSEYKSQYEQSMPITTPSIGYKEYGYLVTNSNTLYPFRTSFSNSLGAIIRENMGLTTFTTEYNNSLYLMNSLSNITNLSNVGHSFPGAAYASSISTFINRNSIGSLSSITYLLSTPSTLQNYNYSGNIDFYSSFAFKAMSGNDSNITTQRFEVSPSMNDLTLWLWGGGGSTWSNTSNITGGAGGYIKAQINVNALLNTVTDDCPGGISTLYIVVGKGGNRDNIAFIATTGVFDGYEQPRYGGGGTSIIEKSTDSDNLTLQGGGFTGIFTGSNLLTATPLLIVGGGGAAGAYTIGGPGGIGIEPEPLPIVSFPFSFVTANALFYGKATLASVIDLDSNVVLNNSNIGNIWDDILTSYWDPTPTPYINPTNYLPSPNTYRVNLSFTTGSLLKLRYYGPSFEDTMHLPSGFIIYANENRSEILYSNTSIAVSDYQIIDNGSFKQFIYEMLPTSQPTQVPMNSNGWIVGGSNTTSINQLQYSINSLNWTSILTNVSPVRNIKSIQYISSFSSWYACGTGGIMKSIDGLSWTPLVTNVSTLTSIAVGPTVTIATVENGDYYTTTDGQTWSLNPSKIFTSRLSRIRYINGLFWATGYTDIANTALDIVLISSPDAITWTPNLLRGSSSISDITYGAGLYVCAQANTSEPYYSGLLYSSSGTSWSAVSPVNVSGFSATSITFANNIFVAVGSTTDATSFIKHSTDGINWRNSSIPSSSDAGRNEVQFVGGIFICVGKSATGSGKAGNQPSILKSSDGQTWSYSLTGGFNSDLENAYANTVAYGPLTIPPSLTSCYVEIQKTTNTAYEPLIYELRPYNTSNIITESTAPIYDRNTSIVSAFQPIGKDIIDYPFTFTFSGQKTINKIRIYTGTTFNVLFTGITIQTDSTNESIIYKNLSIIAGDYIRDNDISIFEVILSPAMNTESFIITITKTTVGPISIHEVEALYDNNIALTKYSPLSITDIDKRVALNPLTTMTDGLLTTAWSPSAYNIGSNLRINYKFTSPVPQINTVHLYNGVYGSRVNMITGIYIYSDSNKSQMLYSNDSPISRNHSNYNLFDLSIDSFGPLTDLYFEFAKVTPGLPVINELNCFNSGTIGFISTVRGYAGGPSNLMQKATISFLKIDGGGGSTDGPGSGGMEGFGGEYLTGGSPVETGNHLQISTFKDIQGGAGGGGGGYYGGGGGGIVSGLGGAGGGGAGYIYNQTGISLVTVLDFGTAYPSANYVGPGFDEYKELLYSNLMPNISSIYSQGGIPTVDSGRGQHGVVVIKYESTISVVVPDDLTATPKYIDGSRLSLFQSPIAYNTNARNLAFTTYKESIENTVHAGYNWVWYRSYLLLTGNTLTSSMAASSLDPLFPSREFPSLPGSVYDDLASQFANVSTFYGLGRSNISNIDLISRTSAIAGTLSNAFGLFQSTFVQTSYTDTNYKEMTEIYCLLDYLKNSSNLVAPHINPSSSSMDRMFGGVPRFGYWANPFLVNASYIGFDVGPSMIAPINLQTISGNRDQVTAFYGLILEQSLSTGLYSMVDVMAYKPTVIDFQTHGSNWAKVSQFTEAYHVRNLTDRLHLTSNIPIQPFSMRNGINAQIPLFNYKVYTTPLLFGGSTINSPIHMINDFNGNAAYFYSFQNVNINNTSSINITVKPVTSTIIQMNQTIVTKQANTETSIMGTLVSELKDTTVINSVNKFGYNQTRTTNFLPVITYSSDFYNTYIDDSEIKASNIGKAITDSYGNLYATNNTGGSSLYENICTFKVYHKSFTNSNVTYASGKHLAGLYANGSINPDYDFLLSKTTNIWHIQGTTNLSTIYGARLSSPYDFNITTNFANQIFYPVHKIILTKKGSSINPIIDKTDVTNYPSYPHTEMFFYKNFSTLSSDIQGKFALEKTSNFAYKDMQSGYLFNSYINNINLSKSDLTVLGDDGFNYLAIRGYTPSESFKTMLRFYLPERYDFGYVSFDDLSGERLIVNTQSNVNPEYRQVLLAFHASFSTSKIYGSTGLPGFSGSNLTTLNFGDFLNKYNIINSTINSSSYITSTVNGYVSQGQSNLITGDLRYILPSYLANRQRITDPLEFQILFSTIVSSSNRGIEEYGLGYNIGFDAVDTPFNTVQRATSFFKILDDYIYLRMNPEYNMNRLDISQQENFAETHDSTAQGQLYNCKLILNNFGTYATTLVQNPVNFNPPIGKLDKLSFAWYDITGTLINNLECEWSGAIQVVEKVDVA